MALLASGQAFATVYTSLTSVTNFTDGTKWATATCGGTAVGGTITPAAADTFLICGPTSLMPTALDVVNFGTLQFGTTATWGGGVLKFSSGNKTISNGNSLLASIALDVSSMATGDTITLYSPAQSVKFSSVAGGSLSCGGSAYTIGNAIIAGTTCAVTLTAAPPPSVSAPLDFDFNNKPAKVFTTEVKVK